MDFEQDFLKVKPTGIPLQDGVMLVSVPFFNDTFFNRSVVLLTDYAPDGAAGLIVNRHVILSFLPLSHVYERVCNYMYQILGSSIYYATSLASIAKDLKDIHSTGFCAVPRVLETMFNKLQAAGKDLKGIKKRIYKWAFRIAQVYDNENQSWFYKKKYDLADKLVYSKWRENLGGMPMIIVSGGSSIQEKIIRTFTAAKLQIYEGYGLTETSPVISVNNPRKRELHPGTVGPILPGVEFKLADDGEILTKGDCLMVGYYKDDAATKAVVDEEGWLVPHR